MTTPSEHVYTAPTVIDGHDYAIIGIVIHPSVSPKFSYSLTKLLKREMIRGRVDAERAKQIVWAMIEDIVTTHGDRAPIFIDDEVSQGEVTDDNEPAKSKIITLV